MSVEVNRRAVGALVNVSADKGQNGVSTVDDPVASESFVSDIRHTQSKKNVRFVLVYSHHCS